MKTKIQATVVGFQGRPCTLFSLFDTETKVLAVAKETDYRSDRAKGCVVITNDSTIARDQLFTDAELKAAITAYYELDSGLSADNSSSRLNFSDAVTRNNPSNAIERDGIDASGQKYRVAEGVTNGQIAVLATCLYATKADCVQRTVDMAGDLQSILRGGSPVIFSI